MPLADAATLAQLQPEHEEKIERAEIGKKLAPESLPKGATVASLEVQPALDQARQADRLRAAPRHRAAGRRHAAPTSPAWRSSALQGIEAAMSTARPGASREGRQGRGHAHARRQDAQTCRSRSPAPAVAFKPDFIRDVTPVLAKAGCNAGTCHGAKEGKNGFKLSLRGYDPVFDVAGARPTTLAAAASNVAVARRQPDAAEGDRRRAARGRPASPMPGEPYYEIIRAWIADGAKLELKQRRACSSIEIFPKNPVVQAHRRAAAGPRRRHLRRRRDARRDRRGVRRKRQHRGRRGRQAGGLVTTLRRGEAPVLARYEGAYAATTLTVMGDRTGFAWEEPPAYNQIDELVAAKWKRMKILPVRACAATPSSSAASTSTSPACRRRRRRCARSSPTPRDTQAEARRADRQARRQRRTTSSTGPTSGPTCSR